VSEVRAGAAVHGPGGELGTVEALVIEPATARLTHLVVGRPHLGPRVLVTRDHVLSATPEVVELDLDGDALGACPTFDEPYAGKTPGSGDLPPLAYEPGALFLEPYVSPLDGWVPAPHECIPEGEITIRRGDEVVAGDGAHLGHVDELLIDPADGRVTHVVLRRGVLFTRRDVIVPLGGATFEEGRIALTVTVAELDRFDRFRVRRHRHVHVADG
jgi:sporulation protein YlmC with PRC-barrel domain